MEKGELEHDCEPATVPNTHIYKVIISDVADVEAIDVNAVGRIKLPISKTDLCSCANVFVVVRNY